MSNALATRADTRIVSADDWTDERVEFIRNAYCGGAPDAQAEMFIQIARRRGLAPEEKHIYLIKRGDNWTIQTSIDGYRLIADRTGDYAGSDDPVFEYDGEAHPSKASVTVWKFVKGQRCAFTASARWTEYLPPERQRTMWLKMPHTMLGKCAEALALRKAFPAQLSGIYTDDEMEQAGSDREQQQVDQASKDSLIRQAENSLTPSHLKQAWTRAKSLKLHEDNDVLAAFGNARRRIESDMPTPQPVEDDAEVEQGQQATLVEV